MDFVRWVGCCSFHQLSLVSPGGVPRAEGGAAGEGKFCVLGSVCL